MQKLVETVLQEAAVTDAVMASCFEEMDADHSGTIEWCAPSLLVPGLKARCNSFVRWRRLRRDEFANFFDLAQSSV